MKKSFGKLKKNERGQALVEFALVALPLLLLVLGMIEFGWIFNGQISLTSAAREGARAAVVSENYEAAATAAVSAHIATSSVTLVGVNVASVDVDADNVTISVTATGSIEPLVKFFIRDTFNLTAEATMRKEYKDD